MNTSKTNPAPTPTQTNPNQPAKTPARDPDQRVESPSNVLNLSTIFSPMPPQIAPLEKGLTFIPHPHNWDCEELHRDLHQYHRRINLIDYFQNPHPIHQPIQLGQWWFPVPRIQDPIPTPTDGPCAPIGPRQMSQTTLRGPSAGL